MLATSGLSGITYALIEWTLRRIGMSRALRAWGCLQGVSGAEARCVAPMMPLSLFRSRSFVAANLLTFFSYAAFEERVVLSASEFDPGSGLLSPTAGAALLPLILLLFLLSRWSVGWWRDTARDCL